MRLGDRLLVLSLLDALGVGAAREVLTMVIATVYELRFMFAIGLGCLFNTALGAGGGRLLQSLIGRCFFKELLVDLQHPLLAAGDHLVEVAGGLLLRDELLRAIWSWGHLLLIGYIVRLRLLLEVLRHIIAALPLDRRMKHNHRGDFAHMLAARLVLRALQDLNVAVTL